MKIIKLIMALGICICLFLPLSQCSQLASMLGSAYSSQKVQQKGLPVENAKSERKDAQENEPSVHRVISSMDDLVDFNKIPVLIGFLLPLLFCISLAVKKWKIMALILQTVNQGWLIYLTLGLVWFLSEPLWGGYLLTLFVLVYSLITIAEWINVFRKKQSA